MESFLFVLTAVGQRKCNHLKKIVCSQRIERCSPFFCHACLVALANTQHAQIGKTKILDKCLGINPSSAKHLRALKGKCPRHMCQRNDSLCSDKSFALILGHDEGSSSMRVCFLSKTSSGKASNSDAEVSSNCMKSCVVETSDPSSS